MATFTLLAVRTIFDVLVVKYYRRILLKHGILTTVLNLVTVQFSIYLSCTDYILLIYYFDWLALLSTGIFHASGIN